MNVIKILYFTARWSSICRIQETILKEFVETIGVDIDIKEIDVDANKHIAKAYSVLVVPTIIFEVNEIVKKKRTGVTSSATLKKEFQEITCQQ